MQTQIYERRCIFTKTLVISDIHEYNQGFAEELLALTKKRYENVIYIGDVVGTELVLDLQKRFYNGIVNPVKNLKKQNPNPTDQEILSLVTENKRTVSENVESLWCFFQELDLDFKPSSKMEYIRELLEYTHYGHFVSNLPTSLYNILLSEMAENAVQNIAVMSEFRKNGSNVYVIEGNQDSRTPFDFYRGKMCKPLPIEERPFCFKKLLHDIDPEIHYYDKVGVINNKDSTFILLPFDSVMNMEKLPRISRKNKEIVLFSHAQVEWKPVSGGKPMTSESQKINDLMKIFVKKIKPNFVFHGHAHDGGHYFHKRIPVIGLPIQTYHLFIN